MTSVKGPSGNKTGLITSVSMRSIWKSRLTDDLQLVISFPAFHHCEKALYADATPLERFEVIEPDVIVL